MAPVPRQQRSQLAAHPLGACETVPAAGGRGTPRAAAPPAPGEPARARRRRGPLVAGVPDHDPLYIGDATAGGAPSALAAAAEVQAPELSRPPRCVAAREKPGCPVPAPILGHGRTRQSYAPVQPRHQQSAVARPAACEALRRHRRARRDLDLAVGTGRGLRLPRSERRRQDHDDPRCCSACTGRAPAAPPLFGLDSWREAALAHRRVAYVAGEPLLWPAADRGRDVRVPGTPCTAAPTSPTATSWSSASGSIRRSGCGRSRRATGRRSS